MLLLSESDVRELLPMKEAIEVNNEAFLLHAQGEAESPLRTSFGLSGRGRVFFMPAYVKGGVERAGIKIVSLYPGNPEKGLPSVPAQVLLLDPDTGEVCAMMNGSEITRIRTAAISGAATELLAKRGASVAALFGTGGQAASQLEALLCVRPIREVRVFDVSAERAELFIERMTPLADKNGARLLRAESSDGAIDGADVISTVTTSQSPVFDGSKAAPGAHVNGVGSATPGARELDEALLNRARVFVDNREATLAEAGDFLIPIQSGAYDPGKIEGEIGDVIAGKLPGRSSDGEITVLKTVGFAALDIVAADRVYRNALARGFGTRAEV